MSRHRSPVATFPDPPIDRVIQYLILPHQDSGMVPWEQMHEFYTFTDHLGWFYDHVYCRQPRSSCGIINQVVKQWGLTEDHLSRPTPQYCPIGIALIFIHIQEL